MLSNQHYYHRITRKLVVAFGTMFNNLRLVRYDSTTNPPTEVERINVPLMYASKEKFYQRITAAPDNYNPVNISLPRMAFEMNGISYDPLRKISTNVTQFAEGLPTGLKKVHMTPYNFDFNLYCFVRNTEDGLQIVEQILPYFTPDYTLTIDFVGIDDMKMDVPIVFNSITYDDSHEGDPESTRSIIWTLNFTMKGWMFGPISNVSIIKSSTANVYDNTFATNPLKQMVLEDGNGNYKYNELVYQGRALGQETASGFVRSWSNTSNAIVVYDTNGTFTIGDILYGSVSGASYNVASFSPAATQLVNINVKPDPATANNIDEAFGFITTITEY